MAQQFLIHSQYARTQCGAEVKAYETCKKQGEFKLRHATSCTNESEALYECYLKQ